MYSISRYPQAIAHRGLRRAAPENSMPAFLAAIAAGAEGIELDVHAAADGTLFVHHDFAVAGVVPSGVGGAARPISTLDASRLSRIELAPGVTIPRLDDVLEEIGGRVVLFIELKAAAIEAAVVRCLRRHPDSVDRHAVHSFDHRVVRAMAGLVPPLRTGVLQASYPVDSCAVMRAAGATDLWQRLEFIDQPLVSSVRACGGRVIAWTSNAPVEWDEFARIGVNAICTDRVDEYVSHARGRMPPQAAEMPQGIEQPVTDNG